MHYLRNQTENYCAETKHTQRRREKETGGAREVREIGVCVRKEVGKRKGGLTCMDVMPDKGKGWRGIDLRRCVGGMSCN